MSRRNAFDADVLTSSTDDMRRLSKFLLEVQENPLAWKWVSLALNSALYGFAALSIVGDSDLNLAKLPVTIRRKGRESIKVKDVYSLQKLRQEGILSMDDWDVIGPQTILERCSDAKCIDGKPLTITDEQKRAIDYLREELRNWYSHPKPEVGVGIMTEGLPKMCKDVLEVILFLVADGIGTHRWETELQKQEVIGLCTVGLTIVREMIRQQDMVFYDE